MTDKKLPHDHGQKIERELEHMPGTEAFQTVETSSSRWATEAVCVLFGFSATAKNVSSTFLLWWT